MWWSGSAFRVDEASLAVHNSKKKLSVRRRSSAARDCYAPEAARAFRTSLASPGLHPPSCCPPHFFLLLKLGSGGFLNSLQSLSLEIGIEGSIVTYKRRLARSLCISSLRTATVYGRPPLGLPQIAETWPYSPKYLVASPTESSWSLTFKCGLPSTLLDLLGAAGCCWTFGSAGPSTLLDLLRLCCDLPSTVLDIRLRWIFSELELWLLL